jgi:hypothetical protein
MWEDLVVEDKFSRVSVAKGLQSNRINAVMFTSRQIHIDVESISRTYENSDRPLLPSEEYAVLRALGATDRSVTLRVPGKQQPFL